MKKIFDDDTDIYLQGRNALTDGKLDRKLGLYTKFLVGSHPDLVLEDLRGLGWRDVNGFNVKSHAQIFYDGKRMKIVLLKPSKPRRKPVRTLVFGVIYDRTIPAWDVEWEVFKASTVSRRAVPFVTLIKNGR